jgi:O-antigen ligase
MLKAGLALSLLLTIPGELIRIPIGPGNGLLLNDIFLPILIAFWVIKKIGADRKFKKTLVGKPLVIFIGIAIISLVSSLRFLETNEVLASSLYLIRFIEYAFLYFITIDLVSKKDSSKFFNLIILTGVLLAIGGFIQLQIYPDFRPMEDLGWDPHVGRLLGTWFDPNFIGGGLAFITCLALGKILTSKKPKPILIAATLLMTVAILYTYSRSAYLALAAGVFVMGTLKSRKFLLTIIIGTIVLIPMSDRAQTRIVDMYHSAKSLVSQTAETPDITAQHRLNSWKRAVEVYAKHPILGSGYNTFKYVQSKEGLITNIRSHASTGSDSSLLTILATTGPLGLLAFLSLYILILKHGIKNYKKSLPLGLASATSALLIHSVFVNSLLFPHMMVLFWVTAGLMTPSRH